jgi:hypothetical protein
MMFAGTTSSEKDALGPCDPGSLIFQIGWWLAADSRLRILQTRESAKPVPDELPNSFSNWALGILPHRDIGGRCVDIPMPRHIPADIPKSHRLSMELHGFQRPSVAFKRL